MAMVDPLIDLINMYVLQAIPHADTATSVLGAAAAGHLVLRDMRKLRRGVLRPIRFAARFVRGAVGYAVLIGIVWAVITYGKTTVLQQDSGPSGAAAIRMGEGSAQ